MKLIYKAIRIIFLIQILVVIGEGISYSQTDSLVNLPNLLLPRFTKSVVKLKSGAVNTAVLNYNTVEQEMVFMQDKQFFILDNPMQIDSVFMSNRTFVPMEKGFYEVLLKGVVTLFRQHKSYVEFEGYPTAYGAKSQAQAPNYVRQIYGSNGAINLKVPKGYKVVADPQYWVRYNMQMRAFDNKRTFLKIFPEKEKELSSYIDKKRIDFKKADNVKDLIAYCNTMFM